MGAMFLRSALVASVLFVAAACSSSTDSADSGNPPLLDPSSGWQRVGRVPMTIKTSNAMTAVDLTLSADGQVHAMYTEGSLASSTGSFFNCEFAPGAAPKITPLLMGEATSGGGTDHDNSFFFLPGSGAGFHALNTYPHGNLAVATSEVRRDDNSVFLPPFQGNGGTYSGALPQMLSDGSLIYSTGRAGGGVNGPYWWQWLVFYDAKTGATTRAITQGLSEYTPHTTIAFRAARLPSNKIYGALTSYDDVAIATVGPPKQVGEDSTLERVASATFAGHAPADTLLTRTVGDSLVFVTWNAHLDAVQTFSGYRWKEGTTTIEQLYANVAAPSRVFGPSEELAKTVQLDDKGDVWFFGAVAEGSEQKVALVHVGAGVSTIVSRPALGGTLNIGALRLLGGQWYAGVGPTSNNMAEGGRYLDIVRLNQ
jgi:hypothetical protein